MINRFDNVSKKTHNRLNIIQSIMYYATHFLTSIVSTVHPSMMVTHSVKVVQIVMGKGHVGRLVVLAWGLSPGWWQGPRAQIPHTLTPLHHMGGHVQTSQRETHQGWQLVPPLAHLFQHFTLIYSTYMCDYGKKTGNLDVTFNWLNSK